jgi:twitching motility two-component system response regulator PilG
MTSDEPDTFPATLPLGLDGLPAPAASPAQPAERTLRIIVRGFGDMERRLLDGTVRLSLRRSPRLELVSEDQSGSADLLLMDGADAAAVAWFESQEELAGKAVIWVDAKAARDGSTLLRRPVQWSTLPMVVARALEQSAAPAAKRPGDNRRAGDADAPRAAGAPHVLVVDDSLAVRNHLRSLLEARGLEVTEADCVRAALDAVAARRYACVLMDVLMPDMDGYEGCKRIKSLKASLGHVPVVMLTSRASPFDRIRGKMAGCDAYLTKPVAPERLHEVVAQCAGTAAEKTSDAAREPRARTQAALLRRASAAQGT